MAHRSIVFKKDLKAKNTSIIASDVNVNLSSEAAKTLTSTSKAGGTTEFSGEVDLDNSVIAQSVTTWK
jgi:hypothetical protein